MSCSGSRGLRWGARKLPRELLVRAPEPVPPVLPAGKCLANTVCGPDGEGTYACLPQCPTTDKSNCQGDTVNGQDCFWRVASERTRAAALVYLGGGWPGMTKHRPPPSLQSLGLRL